MEYDVELSSLTEQFLLDYPEDQYPEIIRKESRPYACLLVDTHDGFIACIPFRSSVPHRNAFHFKDTRRSKRTRSGLDYSKMVLVNNTNYFSKDSVVIDNDEYVQTIKNLPQIVKEAIDYIDAYKSHVVGDKVLHNRKFEREYQYSTLPYFHDVLGIEDKTDT